MLITFGLTIICYTIIYCMIIEFISLVISKKELDNYIKENDNKITELTNRIISYMHSSY
jgi:hypothetical protein